MRIISGKHKGRRLVAPKNLPVRPTADMQKEALFSILNNRYHLDELHVLDLFSGTGNIAYEFASRGAENIIAVDAHFGCVKYITATSKKLDLSIECIKSDVFKYLKRTGQKFDLIFADPPYKMNQADFENIPKIVFDKQLINEKGVLIVEHSSQTDLSKAPNFIEVRKYGGSVFSFFEN